MRPSPDPNVGVITPLDDFAVKTRGAPCRGPPHMRQDKPFSRTAIPLLVMVRFIRARTGRGCPELPIAYPDAHEGARGSPAGERGAARPADQPRPGLARAPARPEKGSPQPAPDRIGPDVGGPDDCEDPQHGGPPGAVDSGKPHQQLAAENSPQSSLSRVFLNRPAPEVRSKQRAARPHPSSPFALRKWRFFRGAKDDKSGHSSFFSSKFCNVFWTFFIAVISPADLPNMDLSFSRPPIVRVKFNLSNIENSSSC